MWRRKLHDVNIVDQLIREAGAFYVVDRVLYVVFGCLAQFDQAGTFFLIPVKRAMHITQRAWHKTNRSIEVI